uniref:Uncharacterized protein n=1 Tax=Anguilla anguilla TaxID=7936 RepID=A0A0E9X9R0_ANGAN
MDLISVSETCFLPLTNPPPPTVMRGRL